LLLLSLNSEVWGRTTASYSEILIFERMVYDYLLFKRVFLFLVCIELVSAIDLFHVHKNGSIFLEHKRPYFAWNQTKHLLPNRFTMIGYGNWEPQQGTAEQLSLRRGEDIEDLWVSNKPNTYVLDKGGVVGSSLIVELHSRLSGYTNAALLLRPPPFSDWIVKVARHPEGSPSGGNGHKFRGEGDFRILHIDPANPLHRHLANATSLGANLSLATAWLDANLRDFTSANPSVPFVDCAGVDPRLVVMEGDSAASADRGRVLVIFAVHHRHAPRLYTTEVLFPPRPPALPLPLPLPSPPAPAADKKRESASISLGPIRAVTLRNTPLFKANAPQKNWVPFAHGAAVYYVSHLWPFNVVELQPAPGGGEVHAAPRNSPGKSAIVRDGWVLDMGGGGEEGEGGESPWKFGPPHGSTQGVRMPNGEFLAFFHSYTGHYRDRVVQTYVIGAVTWRAVDAETEPGAGAEAGAEAGAGAKPSAKFRLTRISTVPIIPSKERCSGACADFYRDRWLHDTRLYGYIDYAVFPVSLIREGGCAFVMFAYQNTDNYVAKVSVDELLRTMKEID
jgi:hypothetical protein